MTCARMRLRDDPLGAGPRRDKLQADLIELDALVEEGVACARSAQSSTEPMRAVDLNALLDGLVCDYVDAGHLMRLEGSLKPPLRTRPLALKRLVTMLAGALKGTLSLSNRACGGLEARLSLRLAAAS